MARPSLAELKNRFKEKNQKREQKFENNGFYKFWEMAFGKEAHVRLIPDANEENPTVFSLEKFTHKLIINGKDKTFPCLSNYGEFCPVCDRSQKYYNAKDTEKGKYYWKKKTTLIRALVIEDPIAPEAGKENCVGKGVTLSATTEVMNRLTASLAEFADNDPDPWDLDQGCNFIIRKDEKSTPDGAVASYVGSGFARRSSSIPEQWRDEAAPVDLRTLLPKNPGLEAVVAILEAHDTGGDYDDSAHNNNTPTTPTKATPAAKETKMEDKPPFDTDDTPAATTVVTETKAVETAPVTTKATADEDDILSRIRNRTKK